MLNSMVINKPPGSKWHPPHQDAFYVPMRPIEKILTAWTAVDPVFETNGSLFVVPGSHKENIIHPEVNVPDLTNIMYFMIPDVDAVAPYNKRVTVAPMEPGDTVFFHPLLVHGSWPNTSNMFRKAITSLYVSQESYYIDVKGTPLEAFEKSLNEVIKGMYGPDVGEIVSMITTKINKRTINMDYDPQYALNFFRERPRHQFRGLFFPNRTHE
ncbi:unnamed protein product [Diatraea saccharalis]|uniref:phytanoyl-CoA dioxygenase n=1 Tax=Diatraea saccharalis TaxID=40085 RepID=A0A9P0C704_9NEOP|nr:unnamed protein product [Diatraea saccharalis]